jgi:hypothetical protein
VAPASALATGTISGVVTADAGGAPIENACVRTVGTGGEISDTTDALGQYELANVPAGSVKLRFGPCTPEMNYLVEFYDEKTSSADANPVTVTNGGTTTVNESLATGRTISGTVTDQNGGAPIEGYCVEVEYAAGGFPGQPPSRTNSDGEYTIIGLRDGSYKLHFQRHCALDTPNYAPEYYDNKPSFDEATVIVVNGADRTGIDAQLVEAGKISGTVTAATGGAPVANFCVRATLANGNEVGPVAVTNTSGEYTIAGLEDGSYRVRFSPCTPLDNFVTEWYSNKRTLAASDPVSVTLGTTTQNINAAIETGGSIAGTLTDDVSHAPLQDFCVSAQGTNTTTLRNVRTDGSGDYSIVGLPTDTFKVRFFACNGEKYRPEFYSDKASFTAGDPVSVTEGEETGSIDAGLTFDDVPPETSILSGPTGVTSSTSAAFALAGEPDAVSGQCRIDGSAWETCFTSKAYSNLAPGSHTFEARAIDAAANVDPTPATRTWTVDPNATTATTEATVPPGGQATTDPTNTGPTPAVPITTAVTSPSGGAVTITENLAPSQPAPAGFELFGREIVITAPPGTVSNPLRVRFQVDASAIPPGTDLSTVSVVRDGELAGDCQSLSEAIPDPCVLQRNNADGDLTVTVLTSHASTWSIVRVPPVAPPGIDPPDTGACKAAKEAVSRAEKKVKSAKKALAKAKKSGSASKVKRAKAKLKSAKKKLRTAKGQAGAACD